MVSRRVTETLMSSPGRDQLIEGDNRQRGMASNRVEVRVAMEEIGAVPKRDCSNQAVRQATNRGSRATAGTVESCGGLVV